MSEDSSKHAVPTVTALVRRMMQIVCPHPSHLVEWMPIDDEHAPVVHAMNWRSKRNAGMEPKIRAALRTIARRLAAGHSLVLFHIDGDTAWSAGPSANLADYERVVVGGVRLGLSGAGDVEALLKRLIPIVPYYSIEAWTYQNTVVAKELLRKNHAGHGLRLLEAWEKDPGLLDEHVKLADDPEHSLGRHYNEQLATRAYPGEKAYGVEKSFAGAVHRLLESEPLLQELRALASLES